MPWNTLISSGNIYSKPRELDSKGKKNVFAGGPPNEHANGSEHCKKGIYPHKTQTMARRCP